ncbi:MAG: recombinase family protein [Thermodesulfobacteriota bacterium]|nr:recombinase family protein [Thermodesulfobacteriota bacterium]
MQPKCFSYVRFSNPEQLKGDSLHRQIQASEDYAKAHNLILDKELQDHGLSAFTGAHRTKGALGRFLKMIEKGRIPKGSTLIVESLDRLSREQVMDALNQFSSIIRAGVRVVTLADGMEYDKDAINANPGQLVMSLMVMTRAHEESALKSKRLKATWEEKRANIGKKKLTGRAPAWLKLSNDKTEFEVVPERAKVLRQIFEMKVNGLSSEIIARRLNEKGGSWTPKNGWRKSYIEKILRTRAVLGEFQPHTMIKGKRQPVGQPIGGYFPQVVSDDLFYRVQKKLEVNGKHFHGGRTGKVSNLFPYIAKCGYCGGPMAFVNKGNGPKGGQYLVCDKARRGLGCVNVSVRYPEVEKLILENAKRLNPEDILPDRNKRKSEIEQLQEQIEATDGELSHVNSGIANITDTISFTKDRRVRQQLEEKLRHIFDEKEALELRKRELDVKMQSLSVKQEDIETRLKSAKELIEKITEENSVDVRVRLRDRLRDIFDKVVIYPVGTPRITKGFIKTAMKELKGMLSFNELERFKRELNKRIDNRHYRLYSVFYKNRSHQVISPVSEPHLKLDLDAETGKSFAVSVDDSGKPKMVEITKYMVD